MASAASTGPDDEVAIDPVAVGPSTVPNGGKGAFATIDLPKNTVLGVYEGEEITPEEYTRRYPGDWGEYVLGLSAHKFIDAADPAKGNWTRYINAADYPGARRSPNVAFTAGGKIKTLRRIKKGEELFAAYGRSYWAGYKKAHATGNGIGDWFKHAFSDEVWNPQKNGVTAAFNKFGDDVKHEFTDPNSTLRSKVVPIAAKVGQVLGPVLNAVVPGVGTALSTGLSIADKANTAASLLGYGVIVPEVDAEFVYDVTTDPLDPAYLPGWIQQGLVPSRRNDRLEQMAGGAHGLYTPAWSSFNAHQAPGNVAWVYRGNIGSKAVRLAAMGTDNGDGGQLPAAIRDVLDAEGLTVVGLQRKRAVEGAKGMRERNVHIAREAADGTRSRQMTLTLRRKGFELRAAHDRGRMAWVEALGDALTEL